MSIVTFVRLIFLKDARRYVWLLGIVFAMELTVALFLKHIGFYVILPAICAYLIGLYLTMDVIQMDWPGRNLQFILTRPVPGEAVLLAKILFLGLFLILGTWGFQELDYAFAGMPLAPLDHLCLLIESAVHSGTTVAFMALFALFLRKKSHIFFWAFGLYVIQGLAFVLVRAIFPGIEPISYGLNEAQLRWDGLINLLGFSVFIGIAMLAALVRYRTHRFGLPLLFVIGAASLDLALCVAGDRMGDARLAHDWTGKLPPRLSGQIRLTNDSSSQQGERPDQTDWNGGGGAYHTIPGPNVEGIEAPYYCRIVGYHSLAKLRSGKTIRSAADQTPIMMFGQGFGDLWYVPFQAKVIGVSSTGTGVTYQKPDTTLPAFTYLPSRLPAGEDLTGVTVTGEVQLEIHRAYVAGSVPVKPGATFSQPRQQYEITGISTSPGGALLVRLMCVRAPSILRGDTDVSSRNVSWALISRSRNEILDSGADSGFPTNFPVDIATSTMLYSRPGDSESDDPPPPRDLFKGAEVVFINNEVCGQITVPYELKNVTLMR